jgi:hypothetical protein
MLIPHQTILINWNFSHRLYALPSYSFAHWMSFLTSTFWLSLFKNSQRLRLFLATLCSSSTSFPLGLTFSNRLFISLLLINFPFSRCRFLPLPLYLTTTYWIGEVNAKITSFVWFIFLLSFFFINMSLASCLFLWLSYLVLQFLQNYHANCLLSCKFKINLRERQYEYSYF